MDGVQPTRTLKGNRFARTEVSSHLAQEAKLSSVASHKHVPLGTWSSFNSRHGESSDPQSGEFGSKAERILPAMGTVELREEGALILMLGIAQPSELTGQEGFNVFLYCLKMMKARFAECAKCGILRFSAKEAVPLWGTPTPLAFRNSDPKVETIRCCFVSFVFLGGGRREARAHLPTRKVR